MNQILYTGGKKGKIGGSELKKIIIFFAIVMIIFAICLIGLGVNLLSKVKSENTSSNNTTNTVPETPAEPNINVKFESELGGVKVIVTSDTKISTISYWWDEEEAILLEVNDNQYETVILSKQGTHTLKLKITDENGFVKDKSQLVIGDAGPEVTLLTDGVSNYVIRAKDDEQITKLVITLNDETQEIEVNSKEIEHIIPIPEGDSLIDVIVYNINGLSTIKKGKITNFKP